MNGTESIDFTFIVATKERNNCHRVITSLWQNDAEKVELLIAEGSAPSHQRNLAAKKAKGKYLVFLDNDSKLLPSYFFYLKDAIQNYAEPDVIGGPSIVESDNSFWQQTNQYFFSSPLAVGPYTSRYNPIGAVRPSNEKELILCNLAIKRTFFLEHGGFTESLYPHEENEFLRRISHQARIIYHPLMMVSRPPRSNLFTFCQQMFRYGDGRSKDLKMSESSMDHLFYLPAMGVAFLFLLLIDFLFPFLPIPIGPWILFLYTGILALETMMLCMKNNNLRIAPVLFALFPACHVTYGLGIIFGYLRYSAARNHLNFSSNQGVRVFIAHLKQSSEPTSYLEIS